MQFTNSRKKCVYAHMEKHLRQNILENRFDQKHPLPGEIELAEAFNISRQSARKALRNLEKDGLIRRHRGQGTFVVPPEERSNGIERKNFTIMFMVAWIEDGLGEYERNLLEGASEYALRAGHKIIHNSSTLFDQADIISRYKRNEFDIIVWVSFGGENYQEKVHSLAAANIPQILINRQAEGFPCLKIDNFRTMNKIISYLAECGHKDIGFINCAIAAGVYEEREKGYFDTMASLKLPNAANHYLRIPNLHLSKEFKHLSKFIHQVSALVLGGITFLVSFLEWAERHNLKIPDDISVICINDSFMARTYSVPISVYSESRYELGKQAIHTAEAMLRGQLLPNEQVVLNGDLIIRDSCKIIR